MNLEQSFFIECLGDHCKGEKSELLSSKIKIDELFRIAEKQDLGGILYEQLRENSRQKIETNNHKKAVIQEMFFSVNQRTLLKEICEKFQEAGISIICIKGSVLRDYYPIPELRSMGDLDLIIHPCDREKSDRIMTEVLGYHRFVDNHDVWAYNLNQFEIEIHDHLFYEHLTNCIDYRTYFDQIWEHVKNSKVYGLYYDNMYVPEEPFHFVYLMAHAAKHVINNGMGFRYYLDMIFFSKGIKNSKDWEKIANELEKLQLLDFTRKCFALCEKWMSVKMPLGSLPLENSFYEQITEKTFNDGTFGLHNSQNKGANSAKAISVENRNYLGNALKLTIHRLFPPYRDMQLIPWYSFIDGKPWLLPIAWVYRWIYCLINKFQHGYNLLMEPFLQKERIKKRESYIRKWGL